MPNPNNTSATIRQKSAAILGVPEEKLLYQAIESQFPWIKSGEVIWSRTQSFEAAIFWGVKGQDPVLLNGKDGLASISELIISQAGKLPQSISPVDLAGAVRKLTVEPRGFVGCRQFYDKQLPYLTNWLQKDTTSERDIFLKHAADPVLSNSQEEKTWKLKFFYFNPDGGVEEWDVSGAESLIQNAKKTEALPGKSFRWPYRN